MKKHYVILGAILCLLQVEISGQDTLRIEDIFKKGKKQTSGQQNNRKKTANLEVENSTISFATAIDPYVMLVETRYQITKDGKFYGKEELPYYGKKYEVSGKDAAGRVNSNGFGVTSTGGKTYIGLTRSSSQSSNGMLILYFLGNDDNPDSLIKKVIFISPEWHEGRAIIPTLQDSGFVGGLFMECVPQDGKILFRFAGMVVSNHKNPSQKEILSTMASSTEKQNQPEKNEEPTKETDMDKPRLKEVDKKGKGSTFKK